MKAWVKGWMLGKYGKYNKLSESEDYEEWLQGFKTGTVEIGQFENWQRRFEAFTVLYPALLKISVNLAKNDMF